MSDLHNFLHKNIKINAANIFFPMKKNVLSRKQYMDLFDRLKIMYHYVDTTEKQYYNEGCQKLYILLCELHNNELLENKKFSQYICALNKIHNLIMQAGENMLFMLKDIHLSRTDDILREFREQ